MSWKVKLGIWSAVLILISLPLSMFVVQNLERTVPLSLNLGVGGVELTQPMPIPYLLGITLLIGVVFGWVGNSIRRWRKNVRAERADLAPTGDHRPADDWV